MAERVYHLLGIELAYIHSHYNSLIQLIKKSNIALQYIETVVIDWWRTIRVIRPQPNTTTSGNILLI